MLPPLYSPATSLTHYCIHFVKNGCFQWKVSCYKFRLQWNCKDAPIFIKLGTNVNWTIAFVMACSILNFLLPWKGRDISKIAKNHYFMLIFPSILISKCQNFSMDWDRVEGFSVLVTCYLLIDQRPILASRKSKIFLVMRGLLSPFKPLSRKGSICHPPFDRERRQKMWWLFFNTISAKSKCMGSK
jgi:hypothetical protein